MTSASSKVRGSALHTSVYRPLPIGWGGLTVGTKWRENTREHVLLLPAQSHSQVREGSLGMRLLSVYLWDGLHGDHHPALVADAAAVVLVRV